MKKSTEQSSGPTKTSTIPHNSDTGHVPGRGFWTEVFFTEGGTSLLIIFPICVLYFLVRALG